jgi:nitronate monooxygenase
VLYFGNILIMGGLRMTSSLPEQWWNQLTLPVISAPMFLISGPELVKECCLNGVIGSFPAPNARPMDG